MKQKVSVSTTLRLLFGGGGDLLCHQNMKEGFRAPAAPPTRALASMLTHEHKSVERVSIAGPLRAAYNSWSPEEPSVVSKTANPL